MTFDVALRCETYSVTELTPCDEHRWPQVERLLERCRITDRRPPLGDQALSALAATEPTAQRFAVVDTASRLVAYVQATPAAASEPQCDGSVWTIDIAIEPALRHARSIIVDVAFGVVVDWVASQAGWGVQWWSADHSVDDRDTVRRHGLSPARELLEMRTQLDEIGSGPTIATRPYVHEVDEWSLLDVNNRAFADHPDQGNWTAETLAGRFASDWFDPAGLLVHVDEHGTMLGFCWTKFHATSEGSVGEIYVVAVRPNHQGRGLGRALTHAGMVSLHERHVGDVMLFVDGANVAAQRMYHQLGFTVASAMTSFQSTALASPERHR